MASTEKNPTVVRQVGPYRFTVKTAEDDMTPEGVWPTDSGHVVKVIRQNAWEAVNEITILNVLDHPGVIKLVARYRQDINYYLVEPQYDKIPPADWLTYTFHLLETLAYLEHNHVIHGDIKPENIVWRFHPGSGLNPGTGTHPVLIDFGLARIYAGMWTCNYVTGVESDHSIMYLQSPAYRAPEIWHNHHYDSRVDVWALGCTLYELVTGKTLLEGINHANYQTKLLNVRSALDNTKLPAGLRGLLKQMLQDDKHRRPYARELLKETLFTQFLQRPITLINLEYPYPLEAGWLETVKSWVGLPSIRDEHLATLKKYIPEALGVSDVTAEGTSERLWAGDTMNPTIGLFIQAVGLMDRLTALGAKYPAQLAIYFLTSYLAGAISKGALIDLANEADHYFPELEFQVYFATLATYNTGIRQISRQYLDLIQKPEWCRLDASEAAQSLFTYTEVKYLGTLNNDNPGA